MNIPKPINWPLLARRVGSSSKQGERGGDSYARRALEILLGKKALRAAVDHYFKGGPGAELARSVLWLLHPGTAMQRCYELYKTSKNSDDKVYALSLLSVVADERALPWVNDFLLDSDVNVQRVGSVVLEQLLYSGFVDPFKVKGLIKKFMNHKHKEVRHQAEILKIHLSSRSSGRRPRSGRRR